MTFSGRCPGGFLAGVARRTAMWRLTRAAALAVVLGGLAPRLAAADDAGFVREGGRIFVPANSALRSRLGLAAVQMTPQAPALVLPAVVEADPARSVAVLPPLAGRVVALKVTLGDRVAAGQTLAVLNSPDLDQAFADNDKARDTAALTAANLRRQEAQFRIAAISARDLDQARSDAAQAAAEYARTRARLQALGATPDGPRLLAVRAPFGGSIVALTVGDGAMINDPTQPMMTVADLATVWVTAMVPEQDVASVAAGDAAVVSFYAYPGQSLQGRVDRVGDVIEPDTRREKIRIVLPNPARRFKPNMFATVTVRGAARPAVRLPATALLMDNDRLSVFVEVAPWTFERRTVTAALGDDGTATIGEGLAGGERVVVTGGVLLND